MRPGIGSLLLVTLVLVLSLPACWDLSDTIVTTPLFFEPIVFPQSIRGPPVHVLVEVIMTDPHDVKRVSLFPFLVF